MSDLMKVGPDWGGTGTFKPFTSAISGAQRISDSHGRFMDAALAGRLFSAAADTSALSATTNILSATATPVIGVWNPLQNTVNLVILQASLTIQNNTLTTPVGAGMFRWGVSRNENALTLGLVPFNRRTLVQSGSSARFFTPATALTGLAATATFFDAADFIAAGGVTHGTVTAVTQQLSGGGVQNFDGSLIVPPGGLLILVNTTSTTTQSVTSRLLWEEVPILP